MSLKSSAKHVLHCLALFCAILVAYFTGSGVVGEDDYPPGPVLSLLLLLQRWSFVAAVPVAVMSFLGLVLFNAFPDEVRISDPSRRVPFVCIRTVTKGEFPDLVLENVHRNMKTCFETGLQDFVVEVVTDKAVGLPPYPRLREVVVPPNYRTRNGTLFKARALQYCLEEGVDVLGDDDWVVHLDEETIMTPGSVRGIINFVSEGTHSLGQGLVTYAGEQVVNWVTTLADAPRVADDLGTLRFQLRALRRLLLVWKGSFLITRASLERQITFDHGPSGSITEDINFGMMAVARGTSFGFVEGDMWEKSPFTLRDFVRQRARWFRGTILICLNGNVPLRAKFFLCYCTVLSLALPLLTPVVLLTLFHPVAWSSPFALLRAFVVGTFTYTFPFGVLRSFSLTRLGISKYAACLVLSFVVVPPVKLVLDTVAIAHCLIYRKLNFHVVEKRSTAGTTGETFNV